VSLLTVFDADYRTRLMRWLTSCRVTSAEWWTVETDWKICMTSLVS